MAALGLSLFALITLGQSNIGLNLGFDLGQLVSLVLSALTSILSLVPLHL